mmetsp:Transcript_10986/g.29335  ORF Transcript_10986/g.29335 Transcript_10986/m.29335 type:complete len:688 (-) Transcript_10986:65-2128(-)
MANLSEENTRLRRELAEVRSQQEKEKAELEARVLSERSAAKVNAEAAQTRTSEVEALKGKMVKMTRQLDDEVTRRDQVQAESQKLERKIQDLGDGTAPAPRAGKRGGKDAQEEEQALRERSSQVSTKLMRVVDQWMRQRDLQQALLRGASINDAAFATLVQALVECPSLQTLDLSQNLLTMDSCSDLCQLIITAPSLSFVSLAENLFSLRSVGYFMTAVMERQNTKKLMPLDLLDLQGNEGLVAAAAAPAPDSLLRQVQAATASGGKLPLQGNELVVQVMRSLWRFLHDTGHPQVKGTSPEDVAFGIMDKVTIRKMENALMKILLLGVETAEADRSAPVRPVTANLAFSALLAADGQQGDALDSPTGATRDLAMNQAAPMAASGARKTAPGTGGYAQAQPPQAMGKQPQRAEVRDPFSDLKAAFEPPKEKLKTFNLKQIVTRNGTVLMNMLERVLETTEIDARDVETEQTLLEYACREGNMSLAKLCYRRGAVLSAKTKKGETPFTIVTKAKRYDLMEFLHTYGVKVNSQDADGMTSLHFAAQNDDLDGICRLIEWGADVNTRDNMKRTPIHMSSSRGNIKATMLLLEMGADMNAKDDKEFTAAAHANAKSHFALFDRLTLLGGKRHGLHNSNQAQGGSTKRVGELVVSAGMLKSSSLGRIGKVAVEGMPPPIQPANLTVAKKVATA